MSRIAALKMLNKKLTRSDTVLHTSNRATKRRRLEVRLHRALVRSQAGSRYRQQRMWRCMLRRQVLPRNICRVLLLIHPHVPGFAPDLVARGWCRLIVRNCEMIFNIYVKFSGSLWYTNEWILLALNSTISMLEMMIWNILFKFFITMTTYSILECVKIS